MPQPRFIEKSFEKWRGLHKGYSDLSRPDGFAVTCQNAVIDDNYDITQRKGFKISSQHRYFSGVGGDVNYSGLFTYFYRDSSGNIIEELLTFEPNKQVSGSHKIGAAYESLSVLVQYIGPGVGSISFLPVAGNLWQLTIMDNGSLVTSPTYTSYIDSGIGDTLANLLNTINALPNWVVTVTDPFGLNAGGSNFLPAELFPTLSPTGVDGTGITLTIYAFNHNALWAAGCEPKPLYNPLDWNWINYDAVNMNNLMFVAPCGDFLYKYAGGVTDQVSGTTRSPVYRAGIPPSEGVYSSSVAAGALTGDYVYHTTNVFYDRQGNRIEGAPSPDFSITLAAQNPTLNILSTQSGPVVATVNGNQVNVTAITVNAPIPSELKIFKLPYSSPERGRIGFYNRRAASLEGLQWTTKNVVDINRVANTISFTSAVDVNNGDIITYADDRERFLRQGFAVNGNQVGVNIINTLATYQEEITPFIGDKVYFLDRATGNYVERTVTSYVASTSITVDGSPVNVNANDFISFNNRIAIWRTVAGGTEKYLVAEIPNNGFLATTAYTDSSTDASILANGKYLEPERIPGPPPRCFYLIEHQGLLVCTDGAKIYFSEPDSPENFPDENSFFVRFSVKGDITGLGIDNGALVVFKEYGRAYVYGDLASNAFTSQVIEDGIGCKAGHTIQNTPAGLIWLSHTGFQKSINGVLDPDFNARLSIDFQNQDYQLVAGVNVPSSGEDNIVCRRAVAFNDFRNKRYICYIPAVQGSSGDLIINASSRWYVYDYKTDMIGTFVTPTNCNPANGMTIFQNELFMLGGTVASPRYNYLLKENNLGTIYDAADNTTPIDWIVEPTWDTGGEPSAFKKWLRLKVWLSNPALSNTFTLSLKVFQDFNNISAFMSAARTFVASATINTVFKLITSTRRAIKLQFRNNVLHESPRITGYELEVTLPSDKEIK